MKLSDLSPPKEIATPEWKFKLQEFWRCSTHNDRLNMQVMLRMNDRNGAIKLLESWAPPQPATETKQPAKTPKRKFKYGSYGGWFYPGYHNNSGTDKSSDGADSNLDIQESQDIDSMLNDFTKQCCDLLGIKTVPKIKLRKDSAWSQRNGSFGRFNHDDGVIELALANRHPVDVMRTLAHELVHHRQSEVDKNLPADAGKTGSRYEDEANAVAGQIMRSVAKNYPEVFGKEAIDEGWREKTSALAAAACIAGTPGCATTADTVRGVQDVGRTVQTFKGYGTAGAKEELAQRLKNELRRRQGQLPEDIADEDYDPNGTPPGPEFKPTMPAGTVKVDVSDVYDWYKLGQHISNLKGLGQHDFGSGPPSTILAFGSEEEEHKYIDALKQTGLTTTDIDPVDPNQPKGMPRQKTDPTYNVDEDKQSIDEAQISKNIQPILVKKGYTFLGKGQDQDAYLAPDGTVLKIFGYGPGGNLSKGQQSFKDFADYCMANPNNPFLPQFGGWEPFDFEGKRYLQIKCERMFDLSKSGSIIIGARLGQLASLVQSYGADSGVKKFLRRHKDKETGKLVSLIGGRQQFMLLANTIERLAKLAKQKGYRLDLHGGNFMFGSDGEIVINDPFFTGNWRFDESINEAFDQPYKLQWEKGDHGDVDAIARLDDGNHLSIMFNKQTNQDNEEAWSVEFYRNNSQEVTGEGDAQRVFATVLSAIQTFIKKYKPNRVIFSASKEVDTGQNAQSRARLYDSLVQRYAKAWGFRAFRADTGNKVIYELNRRDPVVKSVAETINTDILNKRFRHTQLIGDYTYKASVERFMGEPLLSIKAYDRDREIGHILFEIFHWENKPAKSHIESGGTEVDPAYRNKGVASTMYAYAKMLGNDIRASYNQTSQGQSMWAAWEKAGDAKHLAAEGQEKFNTDLIKPGFRWSQEINGITYLVRTQWDNMPEVVAKVNNREVGRATFINHHTRSGLESVSTYVSPKWQGHGIAKNMYAVVRMLGANIQPSDTQTAMGKSMWDKWNKAGDTKHLTKLNAKPEQPGLAEATGYIPVNDKEARDPRYSMAITQDIKPGEVQRQARKMGFKTTAAGLPPTLKASGKL